ncbi:hypothetical protein Hanom_Chr12g01077071 [Helianthus anomalus]
MEYSKSRCFCHLESLKKQHRDQQQITIKENNFARVSTVRVPPLPIVGELAWILVGFLGEICDFDRYPDGGFWTCDLGW